MNWLIITSCTGEKRLTHVNQLTLTDFAKGQAHLAKREAKLPRQSAEQIYSGQQPIRLLRGISALREQGDQIDFHIL
mgnify:FL=1